ncbi:MAG: hypothetical protein PVI40_00500 [Chlamydiota bacterium]
MASVSTSTYESLLTNALQIVNANRTEPIGFYLCGRRQLDLGQPIFLEIIKADGSKEKIGITHFINLTESLNDDDLEANARTTNQLAEAIIARAQRVAAFEPLEGLRYRDENGTLFDFNRVNVRPISEDNWSSFTVEGKIVKIGERELSLSNIVSESTIVFSKVTEGSKEGQIQLLDDMDHRPGAGMFIDPATGQLTRG